MLPMRVDRISTHLWPRPCWLVPQVLQAHTVDFPFFTNFWPRPGEALRVDTMLQQRAIQASRAQACGWALPLLRGGKPACGHSCLYSS
jgi:hypothetical protein